MGSILRNHGAEYVQSRSVATFIIPVRIITKKTNGITVAQLNLNQPYYQTHTLLILTTAKPVSSIREFTKKRLNKTHSSNFDAKNDRIRLANYGLNFFAIFL